MLYCCGNKTCVNTLYDVIDPEGTWTALSACADRAASDTDSNPSDGSVKLCLMPDASVHDPAALLQAVWRTARGLHLPECDIQLARVVSTLVLSGNPHLGHYIAEASSKIAPQSSNSDHSGYPDLLTLVRSPGTSRSLSVTVDEGSKTEIENKDILCNQYQISLGRKPP